MSGQCGGLDPRKKNAAEPQGRGKIQVQTDSDLLGCLGTGTLTEPSLITVEYVADAYPRTVFALDLCHAIPKIERLALNTHCMA